MTHETVTDIMGDVLLRTPEDVWEKALAGEDVGYIIPSSARGREERCFPRGITSILRFGHAYPGEYVPPFFYMSPEALKGSTAQSEIFKEWIIGVVLARRHPPKNK